MTSQQIEEIINYLQQNKQSFPSSVMSELQFLFKAIDKEKFKKEMSDMSNVVFVDEFNDDIIKLILNNQHLLSQELKPDETNKSNNNSTNNNTNHNTNNTIEQEKNTTNIYTKTDDKKTENSVSTTEMKHSHTEFMEKIRAFIDSNDHKKQQKQSFYENNSEQLSNYPIHIPPVIPKKDYKEKISNFPSNGILEVQKHIDDINRQIQSYLKKSKELELKNPSPTDLPKTQSVKLSTLQQNERFVTNENLYQWIDDSEIKKLQEELNSFGTPDKTTKIKKYLNKVTTHKSILEVKDYSVFQYLDNDCPNFKEVSQFYKGSFVLNGSKYIFDKEYYAPTPILLLGEPGIGKTHFAKKLAKILGTSFHFLDSNSITAGWILTGSSGQWQNADAGNIFKYMIESNSVSPVVILDEIDKLSHGKSYDPFSVFHQMFEPENATHFRDEFLNLTFNASKMIYILTANNINSIPESLLSRMRVFHIERPTDDEMKTIAQNIYQEIVGNSPLLKHQLPLDTLNKLVSLPPRDIKKQLSNAVFNQLAQCQDFEQELNLNIQITQKNFGF